MHNCDAVKSINSKTLTVNFKPLEKRRLSNVLVLTHKILYNQIDLEATQLFKFSRRPGLRRLDQLDCFAEQGELVEDETVLHAGLLITGIVCHPQSHR